MTVRALCKEYLKYKQNLIKDSTYANYESKIYTHIIPALGDKDALTLTRTQAISYKLITS